MARQHTASQNLNQSRRWALVGLGIVFLFVSLDGPAAQLTPCSAPPRGSRCSYFLLSSRRLASFADLGVR